MKNSDKETETPEEFQVKVDIVTDDKKDDDIHHSDLNDMYTEDDHNETKVNIESPSNGFSKFASLEQLYNQVLKDKERGMQSFDSGENNGYIAGIIGENYVSL